jgi:hypothetical protein
MESTWHHCLRLHLRLPSQELQSAKCLELGVIDSTMWRSWEHLQSLDGNY